MTNLPFFFSSSRFGVRDNSAWSGGWQIVEDATGPHSSRWHRMFVSSVRRTPLKKGCGGSNGNATTTWDFQGWESSYARQLPPFPPKETNLQQRQHLHGPKEEKMAIKQPPFDNNVSNHEDKKQTLSPTSSDIQGWPTMARENFFYRQLFTFFWKLNFLFSFAS